jgi:hypothetical protein
MPLRTSALLAPLALLASACVGLPEIDATQPPVAATPRFDVFTFFDGRLEGQGRLATIASATVPIQVASTGRIEGDRLRLSQTIRQGDKPARTREWIIRQVAPNRYAGTLTDAEGHVRGEVTGNRLRLTFTMNGGLPVEQWLTLSRDGRRAYNVLTVRKFGMPVAMLAEDIRKLD